METRLWILGAPDPEMRVIEDLLREAGEQVAFAVDARGQRVHPGNAYAAAGCTATVVAPDEDIYLVECAVPGAHEPGYTVVDHHRPGDPGYGRPPAEFLAASSVGQVVAELAKIGKLPAVWRAPNPPFVNVDGQFINCDHDSSASAGALGQWWPPEWSVRVRANGPGVVTGIGGGTWRSQPGVSATIPEALILTAAADHCLAAAYRGQCPGVDPGALMRWRAESRASFQGRPVEAVLADVARAREVLLAADTVCLHQEVWPSDEGYPADVQSVEVADLRGQEVPELPEAAAREGRAFLGTVRERDGREKIVLQAASPEEVRAFLETWAPAQGLQGLYGDPARGFAGGYVRQ